MCLRLFYEFFLKSNTYYKILIMVIYINILILVKFTHLKHLNYVLQDLEEQNYTVAFFERLV